MRVLESFRDPRPTTNPYIVQLARALEGEPGCHLLTFSFKRGIFGSYDVFHVHWPEVVYGGSGAVKGFAKEMLFALVLARVQLSGAAVVRTRHNIQPHSSRTRFQQLLDAWVDRLTTATIRLNDSTECIPGRPATTILHGHYRDWYARNPVQQKIPGRIGYFGLIRDYKGVENLLSAFLNTDLPGLTLSIAGKPSSSTMTERLHSMAQGNPVVDLDLRFLSDAELVQAVSAAELIVLPYALMHNSGAALAALSLNRPILVPDTAANRMLSVEVGEGWVHLFSGVLDLRDLESAVRSHREKPPVGEPDLSARSWRTTGSDHLRFFEHVLVWQRGTSVAPRQDHSVEPGVGWEGT